MQFNHTLSAILRGKWLIEKQWADAHVPMVMSFLKGEDVDFGGKPSAQTNVNPTLFIKSAGKKGNVYSVGARSDVKGLPDGSIAMITISGPVMKQDTYCGPAGMISYAQMISKLADAENIDGIILNIDSPGGQADGTALISDVIKNAGTKKPIIAVIDDGMAASAAMWIASAANEIYVTQATDQVGSIGVYTQIADWNKYYREAHKLEIQDIYAPQSTDKNKDYRDATSADPATQREGIAAIEEDLSVLADQFINTVAANRGTKIKNDKWKTGKMFYAKDAQKMGLIDGIKSLDQVVQRITKLANPNSSSNNNSKMAFTKTISAAKADAFAVIEGGFLLEETHLNNIEAALTNAEVNAAALDVANGNVQTLTGENTSLKAAAIEDAKINGSQAIRITELQNQVTVLGKAPSGTGSTVVTKKDEGAEQVVTPSYASDNNPANEWADKQLSRRKKTVTEKV
jgi:protease-4